MSLELKTSTSNDRLDGVYFGDCLDVLRQFPNDVFNLIVTSPPYANARKSTYGGIEPNAYVEWFLPRAAEFYRVLAPQGSFVLNIKEGVVNGERHTYVLELILALKREIGFCWVDEYIWHKTCSVPGKWSNRFRDGWERLLHFAKRSTGFTMHQDVVRIPRGDWAYARLRNLSFNDLIALESKTGSKFSVKRSNWVDRDTVYPTNVLHMSTVTHNTNFSAAFPEWLPGFFIQLFSSEGDYVLDPFLGSGTTYRVARRLGRLPVGIEINPDTHMDLGYGA